LEEILTRLAAQHLPTQARVARLFLVMVGTPAPAGTPALEEQVAGLLLLPGLAVVDLCPQAVFATLLHIQ
jgi:hypothetical protein